MRASASQTQMSCLTSSGLGRRSFQLSRFIHNSTPPWPCWAAAMHLTKAASWMHWLNLARVSCRAATTIRIQDLPHDLSWFDAHWSVVIRGIVHGGHSHGCNFAIYKIRLTIRIFDAWLERLVWPSTRGCGCFIGKNAAQIWDLLWRCNFNPCNPANCVLQVVRIWAQPG